MRSLPNTIVLMFFCVTVVCHAETEPTLPTVAELRTRREAIYAELDRNVEAVKQCFDMLDATDEEDLPARQFLDDQIQQFEHRSDALHQELGEIERFEFLANHQRELIARVGQLQNEADQLKYSGHIVPAQLKLAQVKAIQRTLEDGTWQIFANDQWRKEAEPAEMVSVLQLSIEIENLKLETRQLRGEVEQLRETVRRLERLLDSNGR